MWSVQCGLSLLAAKPSLHKNTPHRYVPNTFPSRTSAPPAAVERTYDDKKADTLAGLQREYETFFNPMEDEQYTPDFEFADPMISYTGRDAHRSNVDMLSGSSALGRLLFSDCSLVMHNSTTAPGAAALTTRWTLAFRFNLLPWKPLARFTGVSEYTLDPDARLSRQQDYWDSVNLVPGGGYATKPSIAALLDLLAQLAPTDTAQAASGRELPYVLLRRAGKYEVRRYPQHISVETEYERRVDAFGTLGAYTGGANEAMQELKPYVPALMSIPGEANAASSPKVMRWPMLVPALERGAAPPPRPSGRLEGFAALAPQRTQVVAVLAFSDPTTEPTVRGYAKYLRTLVEEDGLKVDEEADVGGLRLAQYDALNSFKTRRNEVWLTLSEHPW